MTRRRIALLVAFLVACGGATSTVAAFAADGSAGTPFTVNITEDSSTPTPTPTPAAASEEFVGTTPTSDTPRTGVAGAPAVAPGDAGQAPAAPGPDEVAASPVLFVGGVTAAAIPSLDPFDGTVDVWLTVRNAGTTPIDTTASFAIDGAVFHNRLDAVDEVGVAGLQPGETRVVSARLHHVGQWTLLSASATVTPPGAQDTEAHAVMRDTLVVMFPWLVLLVVVLVVAAIVIVRVLRATVFAAPGAEVTA